MSRSSPAPVTIIIDTREQEPYSFDSRLVTAVRARRCQPGITRSTGMESVVAVERKTLDDFVSTVIHSRARFRRSCGSSPAIARRASWSRRASSTFCSGATGVSAHPNAVLGNALSIILDYRIPVFFCSNRQAACQFVQAYSARRAREVEYMTKAAAASRASAASWRRSSTRARRSAPGAFAQPTVSLVTFAGKVFVRENDAVRLEGHWTNHPKYGRQFAADFMGYRPGDGPGWAGELPGQSPGRERDRPGQSPADRRSFRRALRRGDPQPARGGGGSREGAGGDRPRSAAHLDRQQRLQRRDDLPVALSG